MASLNSNSTNGSPTTRLCHRNESASNRTLDSFLDSHFNRLQLQSSTSSLNTNSVFEDQSILDSLEASHLSQQENKLSITIPETESEAESEIEDNSVIVLCDSGESDNKFSPGSPRKRNHEKVPKLKYFNQEFELRVSAEGAVIASVSIFGHDPSIQTLSDDTDMVTKPQAGNADVDIEDFDSFYRDIATTINQDSTPLRTRREIIHLESDQTRNASVDSNDATSESNGGSVVTRVGRVARQRMQLSFDSNVDKDYVPSKQKSTTRTREQYGQFKTIAPHALIYLELSKDVVADYALEPGDKLVDNDNDFKQRLQKYLNGAQRRRVLFTPSYIDDDNAGNDGHTDKSPRAITMSQTDVQVTTHDTCPFDAAGPAVKLTPAKQPDLPLPVFLTLIHKNMQAINVNAFGVTPRKGAEQLNGSSGMQTRPHCVRHKHVLQYLEQHEHKYDFIKSLDANTPHDMLHPMALFHIGDFASPKTKTQFAVTLYDLYNHKVFNCALDARIIWNRKVKKASYCCNTIFNSRGRQAVIELSETLVSSAKCLSNTLIHEMCHAAAWLFNSEHGHGNYCMQWLCRAKQMLPDLAINVNNCDRPPHVYTYTCTLCAASSQGSLMLKALTEERLRCNYCLGAIVMETYRHDTRMPTPHSMSFNTKQAPSGFARFVKANYMRAAHDGTTTRTHTTIMGILSDQYAQKRNETDT